jgi:outer membrane protein
VLEKYATANGYALVLDVSNQQTPVLWASQTIDITTDIVKLYDQANPGTAAPAAAKAPVSAAPRPAAVAPASAAPTAPKKK